MTRGNAWTMPRHAFCFDAGINDLSNVKSLNVLRSSESDSMYDDGDADKETSSGVIKPVDEFVGKNERLATSSLTSRDMMRAMGTSPRRILLSGLSATGIALAGNFLGITSKLLTTIPEDAVEASGLDLYFPRGDFKRCKGNDYTFVIPSEWVADTFLALAKAQRQTRTLDYQISRGPGTSTLPDSAYGPPGRLNKKGVSEQGDTNVSVVVSSGLAGFSLKGTLGTPTNAAETLLRVSLAPEGSGRTATLLGATEDVSRGVYQFEYTVDRGERGPPLRALSVVAEKSNNTLLTLTVVAPTEEWTKPNMLMKFQKITGSFHVLNA